MNDYSLLNVTSGITFTPGTPDTKVAFSPLCVTFRFVRRVDHEADGLTYTPQFTVDGSNYEDSVGIPVVVVPDDGTGYEVVEVPFMTFLPDGTKSKRVLARVQVTLD